MLIKLLQLAAEWTDWFDRKKTSSCRRCKPSLSTFGMDDLHVVILDADILLFSGSKRLEVDGW